jgi:hypothetical protein
MLCSFIPLLQVHVLSKFNQLITTEITQYSLTGSTEITQHANKNGIPDNLQLIQSKAQLINLQKNTD